MDLISRCKEKLLQFRIKELKDVLSQLGLSKQGKKQDLFDRILGILSDEQAPKVWVKKNAVGKEEVAKVVDDIYSLRKMHISGASDLASKGQGLPETSNVKSEEEIDNSIKKICCPCGVLLETEPIVRCDDPKCRVWQHIGCVLIPEKSTDDLLPIPDPFYCQICRLSRADPFWTTIAHPLNPVKLIATGVTADGGNPLLSVEKTFQLTRADKDMLSKYEYDIQAWCMLINDKVSFRMQWPQYADLQVNGIPVRAFNRPGSQLLGANGRDDGPVITPCVKDGNNKITLTGCDARPFCLGARIVKRRTIQQILNIIPKETEGECFEDAVARVCRCIGVGATADTADSDSDIEVVADSFSVNLRCPMSGSRMNVAGRFKPCAHMACFDLHTFVEMNQRSRKWQCPICLKNYSLENVIIDPYFNRITSMMHYCGEDVTEIEVKPDGSWRPKPGTVNGDLGQWHLPDGSLYELPLPPKNVEAMIPVVKPEPVSDGHIKLKIGIKKNCNGLWEVSKPENNNHMVESGNGRFENNGSKVIPMSSSPTGSNRDDEDASVNQDNGGNFDFGGDNNGVELESDQINASSRQKHPACPDVIVLSDSDNENDENENPLLSSENFYLNNHGVRFPGPLISDSYVEDPIPGTGNSCLGLFNPNDEDDFANLWPLPPTIAPTGNGNGNGFQLFGSDANPLHELQNASIHCPTSLDGFTLAASEAIMRSPMAASAPDVIGSIPPSDCGDSNDGLVDNPLAFAGNDPSLQIFLPTCPADVSAHPSLRDRVDLSNTLRPEDWISLSLGGGSGGQLDSDAAANGVNSRHHVPSSSNGHHMSSLADTASLLVGINDGTFEKPNNARSDTPFSFPRQRRSVRPRLYLSINSDSE